MKKNTSKNTTKVAIIFLVLIVAVVAYFAYLSNKSREAEDEAAMTAVKLVLSRDLEHNYPPTVKEVMKYYVDIQKCLYAEECAEEIKPLLSSAEGLEQAAFTVTLSNETQENGITPKPALDVSFEKEMASDFTLIIRADSAIPSIEEAARMLEAADQTLKANGYFLAEYTIDLQDSEQEDHCLLISDVTPELIEEGNLVKRFYQCESSDLPQEGEPFVRFYPIVD